MHKLLVRAINLISIHALRVEGDCRMCYKYAAGEISIHALRVEGDLPA